MSGIESELVGMGYQIFALAPSRPSELNRQLKEHPYHYQLLSDSKLTVSEQFGLAWHMARDMVESYKDNGADLEKESGETHQLLPVPAAYIIGTDGVVDFAYVNPDHRQRVSAEVLLAAARAATRADAEETEAESP